MPDNSKLLAIFLPDLVVGGAERSMLKLADGIASRGYAVDLLLAHADGPFLSEVPDSVHLVDLGAKRVVSSLPALVRYLRREKPFSLLSVLHANIVALWGWRIAGVPTRVVVSERNTLSVEALNYASDMRMKLMPKLVHTFYPWAKSVVAVSNGVANDLVSVVNLRSECIKVIYNPIITPEFISKTKESIDHPWFLPGEPPVVLSVGRLTAQKGFDILVNAFSKVRQLIHSRLMILGEGEEREKIENLVKQLGLEQDVCLPGFVQNPYPFMVKSKVFVLSSRWEGLPGVLIEALYCGPPLVSTDCPSGAREVLADGKYGRLVPVDDVDAMAQAMVDGLMGKIALPPTDSWRPFELQTVVNQYIYVLFGQ